MSKPLTYQRFQAFDTEKIKTAWDDPVQSFGLKIYLYKKAKDWQQSGKYKTEFLKQNSCLIETAISRNIFVSKRKAWI